MRAIEWPSYSAIVAQFNAFHFHEIGWENTTVWMEKEKKTASAALESSVIDTIKPEP